ncbi:MAG: outer membrane beta-barrel protein [Porphyromonas sp.]|nr:outer membrane beta-barrel protein [Porphyromonas sp.]
MKNQQIKPIVLSGCLLLSLASISAKAQTTVDTLRTEKRVVVVKEDPKNIDVQVFEKNADGLFTPNKPLFRGVYLNGRVIEQRFANTFLGGVRISLEGPSSDKISRKKQRKIDKQRRQEGKNQVKTSELNKSPMDFSLSLGGFGFGTATMLGDGQAHLHNASSLRYTIDLLNIGLRLGQHISISPSMNIEFNSIHFDDNHAYYQTPDKVELRPYDKGEYYKSRLHTTYLAFPVMLRYHGGRTGAFRVGFGPEIKIRTASSSKVWESKHGTYRKLGSDLFLNPIVFGLRGQLSYEGLGIYATYDITPMFQDGKGPNTNLLSVGLTIGM